ncbi:MAG: NAD(P)-dependent oxidoreductase [Burkholderiaceae bacterium]
MEKVGFIGVGLMGSGICHNLLAAGYPLSVVANRNPVRVDELCAAGASRASDIASLVADVDIVMLCVDRGETMRAVYEQMAPSLRRGQLVIDVTTGKPEITREIADKLQANGIGYVDAPVVGGPPQARAGELGSLVGASDDDYHRALPILNQYSKKVVRFGEVGTGITAKLLNNFLTQGTCQLITQAYRAARRHGVDWSSLYEIMMTGAARSGSLERLIGNAIHGNYKGQMFSIANAGKDVDYAGDLLAADPDGAALQAAVSQALQRPVKSGQGELFVSEMLEEGFESR